MSEMVSQAAAASASKSSASAAASGRGINPVRQSEAATSALRSVASAHTSFLCSAPLGHGQEAPLPAPHVQRQPAGAVPVRCWRYDCARVVEMSPRLPVSLPGFTLPAPPTVGANHIEDASNLRYVYENDPAFAALPSFGVIPAQVSGSQAAWDVLGPLCARVACLSTCRSFVLSWPPRFVKLSMSLFSLPRSSNFCLQAALGQVMGGLPGFSFNPMMLLHGEQHITFAAPMPTSGTLTSQARFLDILDKGKGALALLAGAHAGFRPCSRSDRP